MKTKYVRRGLISPYVSFQYNRMCGQQIYMYKFTGGGEKEKEPKVPHPSYLMNFTLHKK